MCVFGEKTSRHEWACLNARVVVCALGVGGCDHAELPKERPRGDKDHAVGAVPEPYPHLRCARSAHLSLINGWIWMDGKVVEWSIERVVEGDGSERIIFEAMT